MDSVQNCTTEINTFSSNEFGTIRAMQNEDGEPVIVAKDVCQALGLGRQQDSTRYLDSDEKGECLVNTPSGQQRMVVVTEPGFYKLVMKSRKPEAKAFQRWVTHEILPAIRKTGGYMVAVPDETPEETMARAVLMAQQTINRQKARIEALEPRAEFADALLASGDEINLNELSKVLSKAGMKIGHRQLIKRLNEDGYLMRGPHGWQPTQKAIKLGVLVQCETLVTTDCGTKVSTAAHCTFKGTRYFLNRYAVKVESGRLW